MNVNEVKAWVEKIIGTVSMVKGFEYYREKRICDLKESEKEDQIVVRASCRGNSSDNYVVWAAIKLEAIIQSYCSCHIGSNGMFFFLKFFLLEILILTDNFKGTCKHVGALLFTWKLSNGKNDDESSNFTSTELTRKLYPGPFSATLLDSPKSKSPSKYNRSPNKKKSPRNVNRHQSKVSKLDIFGFDNESDVEKIQLKSENENLKKELENLRSQNDVLKEKMEKLLTNDFDLMNKTIKRKNTDECPDILFINDDNFTLSPTKKSKSIDNESPVDRAIKILFNNDDDYRQANIPFQNNSSQELLSM